MLSIIWAYTINCVGKTFVAAGPVGYILDRVCVPSWEMYWDLAGHVKILGTYWDLLDMLRSWERTRICCICQDLGNILGSAGYAKILGMY